MSPITVPWSDPISMYDNAGPSTPIEFSSHDHLFQVDPTKEIAIDTGRTRYKVWCVTCADLLHSATTGPAHYIRSHLANHKLVQVGEEILYVKQPPIPGARYSSWGAFHKLWTAAVGKPDYDKQLWLAVEREIGIDSGSGIDRQIAEMRQISEANAAVITVERPIPMLLWCPSCGQRHIDVGEFMTKLHHTHACQICGVVWRPAIVNTVGVMFLPGFKND